MLAQLPRSRRRADRAVIQPGTGQDPAGTAAAGPWVCNRVACRDAAAEMSVVGPASAEGVRVVIAGPETTGSGRTSPSSTAACGRFVGEARHQIQAREVIMPSCAGVHHRDGFQGVADLGRARSTIVRGSYRAS